VTCRLKRVRLEVREPKPNGCENSESSENPDAWSGSRLEAGNPDVASRFRNREKAFEGGINLVLFVMPRKPLHLGLSLAPVGPKLVMRRPRLEERRKLEFPAFEQPFQDLRSHAGALSLAGQPTSSSFVAFSDPQAALRPPTRVTQLLSAEMQ